MMYNLLKQCLKPFACVEAIKTYKKHANTNEKHQTTSFFRNFLQKSTLRNVFDDLENNNLRNRFVSMPRTFLKKYDLIKITKKCLF